MLLSGPDSRAGANVPCDSAASVQHKPWIALPVKGGRLASISAARYLIPSDKSRLSNFAVAGKRLTSCMSAGCNYEARVRFLITTTTDSRVGWADKLHFLARVLPNSSPVVATRKLHVQREDTSARQMLAMRHCGNGTTRSGPARQIARGTWREVVTTQQPDLETAQSICPLSGERSGDITARVRKTGGDWLQDKPIGT